MSRILIVEDEVSFSDPLSYLLRKEGYDVVVAETGPDGLTEFDKNGADLVLLDLRLPDLDGIEVCRELRSRSRVPIIVVSARGEEVDRVVGLELGADDYVTKPFSLRELTARIRALFRRSERPPGDGTPAVVDLGRVQADLAGHRLLRDGRPVGIKPKAFELLAFLVRHPGQVFTRDQLLEHVLELDGADRSAELVNQQGEMISLLQKALQHIFQRFIDRKTQNVAPDFS